MCYTDKTVIEQMILYDGLCYRLLWLQCLYNKLVNPVSKLEHTE